MYLTEIRKSGLTLNLSKCEFVKSEVKYLGHIIGSGRHRPDPSRTETVMKLAPSIIKKQIRQFVGMFNVFRSYIPLYANIAKPLTDMTRASESNVVKLNNIQENAFAQMNCDYVPRQFYTPLK